MARKPAYALRLTLRAGSLARARNVPRLQESLERLAAHRGAHLGVGNPMHAAELLEGEEACAVVDQGAPVKVADHRLLGRGEPSSVERRFGVGAKELPVLRDDQAPQEPIE